jgi:hypothetical protein
MTRLTTTGPMLAPRLCILGADSVLRCVSCCEGLPKTTMDSDGMATSSERVPGERRAGSTGVAAALEAGDPGTL